MRHPFPGVSSEDVAARLAEHVGVICLPGTFFNPKFENVDDDRFIRFCEVVRISTMRRELIALCASDCERRERDAQARPGSPCGALQIVGLASSVVIEMSRCAISIGRRCPRDSPNASGPAGAVSGGRGHDFLSSLISLRIDGEVIVCVRRCDYWITRLGLELAPARRLSQPEVVLHMRFTPAAHGNFDLCPYVM